MSKSGYQKERMQEWFDWRTFDTAWYWAPDGD